MERMEVSYHEAAREKGVLVVFACGYDCVPTEIGQWTTAGVSSAKELRKLRASTKNTQGRVTVPGPAVTKPSFVSWNKALNMWVVILPSTDSVVVCRTMSAIAAGEPPSIAKEDRGLLTMDAARKEVFRPVHFGVYSALPNIFHVLA